MTAPVPPAANSPLSIIRSGVQSRPPRIVLCGQEKVGKSTFAAGAPAPIFIPVRGEEGVDALDVASFPPAQTWEEMCAYLEALKGDHGYRTVVIDSITALEVLVHESIMKAHNVTSLEKVLKGFGKWREESEKWWVYFTASLDALRDRGMCIILITHNKVKKINDPMTDPYDAHIIDLDDLARQVLTRWGDCILFAGFHTLTKTIEGGGFKPDVVHAVGTGGRKLYTQARPAHPGGGRGVYGTIPYELPLTWEAFIGAVKTASEKK